MWVRRYWWCVCVVDGSRLVEEVRSFGATTPDLVALRDWLVGLGVTQVAMESTGVYWKAPYYMLEDEFEVLLVNAAHLKHVPGRKTDVIDAQWIAEVLSYGLLRPSFVPPRPFRELRDLTRYRTSLIRARTSEVNRLHKVLEDAGVTLATREALAVALPPDSPSGGGQVRSRPLAVGWGGGPVVVRARERRAHGEGGQQVGREDAGMAGDRR
jgi:transposase